MLVLMRASSSPLRSCAFLNTFAFVLWAACALALPVTGTAADEEPGKPAAAAESFWVNTNYTLPLAKAGKPVGKLDLKIGKENLESTYLAGKGFPKPAYTVKSGDNNGAQLSVNVTNAAGANLTMTITLDGEQLSGSFSIVKKDGAVETFALQGVEKRSDEKPSKKK